MWPFNNIKYDSFLFSLSRQLPHKGIVINPIKKGYEAEVNLDIVAIVAAHDFTLEELDTVERIIKVRKSTR